MKKNKSIIIANCSLGTHAEGKITYISSGPVKERYLLGTIKDKKATLAGRNVRAIGILTDTAETFDPINMVILGSNIGTLKVRASMPINPGDLIAPDNAGRAANFASLPEGTHHIAGIALTQAAAGELVEFTPTLGLEKTIAPAPKTPTPPAADNK